MGIDLHKAFYTGIFILLLTLTVGCAQRYEYQSTGDELYDRFAELVLEQFKKNGYHQETCEQFSFELWSWETEPRTMDFSGVLAWESEFSDDPRYWQLRVLTRLDDVCTSSFTSENETITSYESQLTKTIEADIYDEASFQLLPIQMMLDDYRAEDLGLNYLKLATVTNPENSYWWYKLAEAYMLFGETDLAWDSVKKGNSALDNRLVQPFPISTLNDRKYCSNAHENMIVSGVVYKLKMDNMPNFIRTKERYKEICNCVALGAPLEMADDWLTMAMRTGQSDGAYPVLQYVGTVYAYVLIKYTAEECLDMELKTNPELKDLYDLSSDLKLKTPNVFTDYGSLYAKGTKETPYSKAMHEYNQLNTEMQMWGPVPDYDKAKATKLPNRIAQDWINLGLIAKYEYDLADQLKEDLDILDPPPFVRWASGE